MHSRYWLSQSGPQSVLPGQAGNEKQIIPATRAIAPKERPQSPSPGPKRRLRGTVDPEPPTPEVVPQMNGKTAKLLNRYAQSKGSNVKDLKRIWYNLSAKERFLKRQELLKELKAKKKA